MKLLLFEKLKEVLPITEVNVNVNESSYKKKQNRIILDNCIYTYVLERLI
jgi:hypothetical protein